MTVTQRIQTVGAFSGRLKKDTSDAVIQFVSEGSQILITANRLDNLAGYSDANIVAAALYAGYITRREDPWTISGYDLAWPLGTPDGYGDLLTTAVNAAGTAWTLAQWWTALKPASINTGTIRVGGATFTGPSGGYFGITRREAWTAVCAALAAEWRVNANNSMDADSVSVLYPTFTAPVVVITDKEQGQDGPYRGLQGTVLVGGIDIEAYNTSVIVMGSGSGTSIIQAVANTLTPALYKDFNGNNLVMQRFVNAPSDTSTTAGTVATNELAKGSSARRQIKAVSSTFAVTKDAKPGDYVYAWNQTAGLVDGANQIDFHGALTPVMKLRTFGLTWPVERPMGVYCRKWIAGVATTIDLSDQWEFENPGVTWEVGEVPMTVSKLTLAGGVSPNPLLPAGAATLGINPAIAARVAQPTITQGSGTPGGTGGNGDQYTDQTNHRVFISDGSGWIIMDEPPQAFNTFTVASQAGTITTVGTKQGTYRRSGGFIEYTFSAAITTNGTGASWVNIGVPVAASGVGLTYYGSGRDSSGGKKMLDVSVGSAASTALVLVYDDTYPAVSGSTLQGTVRFPMTTRYS